VIARSLAILLVAAGLTFGQAPAKKESPPKEPAKPAPGSLEDTLEKALRNSADIKAGEAKVREVEAQLNQVRQQVLTKATALHSDLNLAKRMLAVAEQTLARQEDLVRKGVAGHTAEGVLTGQAMVEKHRGEVEKLETELKSLRGEFAIKGITSVAFSPDGRLLYTATLEEAARVWDANTGMLLADPRTSNSLLHWSFHRGSPAANVPTTMAERVRKLLNQEIEFDAKNISIADAFKWLLEQAKTDVPFRDLVKTETGEEGTIALKGTMPLGAWFQALEDSDPKVCIVVRDYGLLMTKKDRMPTNAVSASELWKTKEAKKDESKPAEKK
jgi:hypothetical protein